MRPKFFFFFPLAFLFFSGVVMLLWNYVIADVIPVSRIHFFQAAGILLISRILFGRIPFGGPGRGFNGPPHHMRAKWMNMTSEEREKLRSELKKRWGRDREAER